MKAKIIAKDKDHLIDLIQQETMINGWKCDLNHIDVSQVLSMSFVFCRSKFNGDISEWDVSNVRSMSCMFKNSEFDGDISKWNVSKVVNMEFMFANSNFSKDLSEWRPYEAGDLTDTFCDAKCLQPYWSVYDIFDEIGIKETIDNYWVKKNLYKDLQEDLDNNHEIKKKIKL
jgi:hypothetical protein